MKVFVHWNIIFDVEIEFEWRFGCTRLSFMSIFTCVPSFLNLIIVSNRISWSQPEIFLKVKILPRTLRFNLLPQVSTCLFCELDIKGLGIVLSLTFYFLLIISNKYMCVCQVASVVSSSLSRCGLKPSRLLCPWDSPGKNTGVGCHVLFQGISSTQGSNPKYILHWQARSLPLAPPGKPSKYVLSGNNILNLTMNLNFINSD